ncbi:MAG: copper homeostasis protein CutC, partial [Cyclobacteriaceae bacterium]|nr:copper homeostasis protein CutC [Cyclobacteriaceae bacterium]
MIKEACVETMAQCLAAEKAGANRLELCAHLELDGLTPEFELIERVVSSVTIPVRVMVRPRAGDFCYSPAEIEDMLQTI